MMTHDTHTNARECTQMQARGAPTNDTTLNNNACRKAVLFKSQFTTRHLS